MRIDNLKSRIRDLEEQIGAKQIRTIDDSGRECWISIEEKDLLDVYLSLLDISAADSTDQPIEISDEVGQQLRAWARAEIPANADPLLHQIRDEARKFLENPGILES